MEPNHQWDAMDLLVGLVPTPPRLLFYSMIKRWMTGPISVVALIK